MKRLLTVGDVARRLRMMPDAVRELERRGRLKAFRTEGGMRLFRESDVERFARDYKPRRPLEGALTVKEGA